MKTYTIESVRQLFTAAGCELLATEYTNARSHLKYRCSCGEESQIRLYSFLVGNRCKKCGSRRGGDRQKLSFEQVCQGFVGQGCKLLEEKYVGSQTKMKYVCRCGSESSITWNNFQRGRRCKKCGTKSRSGENHYMWVEDREFMRKWRLFKFKMYAALKNGLKAGQLRKSGRTEEMLGYCAEELYQRIFSHPEMKRCADGEWHLDHIFPIKAFKEHGVNDPKLINCLDNLRPIPAGENRRKNAKYDKNEFHKWLKTKGVPFGSIEK